MPLVKRANPVPLPLPPSPHVLEPTGTFDGDDGQWSTFFINVGDSDGKGFGQNFKILPWLSSSDTLVPGVASWCDSDCAKSRGVGQTSDGNQPRGLVPSQTYALTGIGVLPQPYWWTNNLTSNSSTSLNATWGADYLGMDHSSTTSLVLGDPLFIVSYTFQDYFLGSLGLASGGTTESGITKSNFINEFYTANGIPSLSYGYTAGASYRNGLKGITGNLVFGGYDKSRLSTQSVSVSMPSKENNSLVIAVQEITYAPDPKVDPKITSFTVNSGGFSAVIDSVLPHLILPDSICDQFQTNFQLQFDVNKGLYTVNASAHQSNKQNNATVSFKLGKDPRGSNEFATIQLPYAAFDQQVKFPIASNATNYFPLSKSHDGVYVLGRTFLQEAYVVVDYERTNFTIAPAQFSDPMPSSQIVSIYNTTYTRLPQTKNSSSSGLSAGAIAGIVIGIVLAFLLIGIGAFVWWRKRHNAKKMDKVPPYEPPPQEVETVFAGNESKHRRVSELTGSEVGHSRKPSNGDYYTGDRKPIAPISEMSPESTPAEMYSPPQESGASDRDSYDYFSAGATQRRARGRHPTSGIAELPGEGIELSSVNRRLDSTSPGSAPTQARGQSDTSLSTNIDEVLGGKQETAPATHPQASHSTTTEQALEAAKAEETTSAKAETEPLLSGAAEDQHTVERRPSHSRGLSDTTIKSDITTVSQPSADELEQWAKHPEPGLDRPMSPPVVHGPTKNTEGEEGKAK